MENLRLQLLKKILRYLCKIDRLKAGVRATLTGENIKKQKGLVDYLEELGVKYINVLPAFAPEEGSNSSIFKWDPLDFAENFYLAHEYAKSKGNLVQYNVYC